MTQPILYIIDDDLDDQDFLINALNEIDPSIKCYTAVNGQEGLLKLTNRLIPIPSLIFLDLNMPRVNGRQFLSELSKNDLLKNIRVIIYSTSSHQKEIDELIKLGASSYLIKQSDYLTLKNDLKKILKVIDTEPSIY